jgi:cobalt/nickel transport system permease protein
MHIPDGILPATVCAAGYALTAGATAYSLRKIDQKEDPQEGVPKAALLTAAFFVASWIHIPIPPTSVHLLLIGLMGVVLGYYAFPAILIGLFFQAVMFQHGGLSTLGVNTLVFGIPALVSYHTFRLGKRIGKGHPRPGIIGLFGFIAGFAGVGLAAGLAIGVLLPSIPSYLDVGAEQAAILAIGISHVPLMIVEGVLTAFVVTFLQRVKPEVLENGGSPTAIPNRSESIVSVTAYEHD